MSTAQSTTVRDCHEIVYDRETHDFAIYIDGELAGFAPTYADADAMLHTLTEPPYAALTMSIDPDDLPDDAPGGDDPETGPYERTPFEVYVSAMTAHVARTYRAHLAAAPVAPDASPIRSAPVGGSAANAADLWLARQRWAQERAAALGLVAA
jgi:hypothetical protein